MGMRNSGDVDVANLPDGMWLSILQILTKFVLTISSGTCDLQDIASAADVFEDLHPFFGELRQQILDFEWTANAEAAIIQSINDDMTKFIKSIAHLADLAATGCSKPPRVDCMTFDIAADANIWPLSSLLWVSLSGTGLTNALSLEVSAKRGLSGDGITSTAAYSYFMDVVPVIFSQLTGVYEDIGIITIDLTKLDRDSTYAFLVLLVSDIIPSGCFKNVHSFCLNLLPKNPTEDLREKAVEVVCAFAGGDLCHRIEVLHSSSADDISGIFMDDRFRGFLSRQGEIELVTPDTAACSSRALIDVVETVNGDGSIILNGDTAEVVTDSQCERLYQAMIRSKTKILIQLEVWNMNHTYQTDIFDGARHLDTVERMEANYDQDKDRGDALTAQCNEFLAKTEAAEPHEASPMTNQFDRYDDLWDKPDFQASLAHSIYDQHSETVDGYYEMVNKLLSLSKKCAKHKPSAYSSSMLSKDVQGFLDQVSKYAWN